MTGNSKQSERPFFLGIEGGGTRTVAILADARENLVQRFEAGPANLKLLSDSQLVGLFKSVAAAFPQPDALGIGMAGARAESDWKRIRSAAAKIWPDVHCQATNDLETALAAAQEKVNATPVARVLILSGTGSCCYGRNRNDKTAKVGGWGHILGDKASGYDIALRALKAVVHFYDRDGELSKLGRRLLHRLQCNEPNEFIGWIQSADKSQIAALAVEVFDAAKKGDRIATDILDAAEESLVEDALACARQLAKPHSPVHFILTGSVLLRQPQFAHRIAARLKKAWRGAIVSPLERESAWGAVALARQIWKQKPSAQTSTSARRVKSKLIKTSSLEIPLSRFGKLSPTEQRHPGSLHLDKLSIPQAIDLMLSDDAKIPASIRKEKRKIAQTVGFITQAFKRDGRLFYVGAGTSGRLGVLDASECPPTFRSDPEMVQGIIAGGQTALWRAVEGAEDDPKAGAAAIRFRDVNRRDVVVGIAASGRTPFVWGALTEAKKRGAKTILLAFNPFLEIPGNARPTLVITPNVGPEILTGSTRLKSGTATKLILNIFTTLAMVRIGKVIGNLMIDLNPSNIKLRDRAVRIIQELRNVDYVTAQKTLEESGWVVKKAWAKLKPKPLRRKKRAGNTSG